MLLLESLLKIVSFFITYLIQLLSFLAYSQIKLHSQNQANLLLYPDIDDITKSKIVLINH